MPGGTANLVAGDVGTGPLNAQSLRALLAKAGSLSREFSFVKRPILRVQFPDNRMPLHGMFFGAGAIYQGTKIGLETKQGIGRMGEWGAGLIMVRSMLALAMGSPQDLGPVTATLSVVEGKASEHEYLVVLVSTLERLFLGLKPFWSDQDGALQISIDTQHVMDEIGMANQTPTQWIIEDSDTHLRSPCCMTPKMKAQTFNCRLASNRQRGEKPKHLWSYLMRAGGLVNNLTAKES